MMQAHESFGPTTKVDKKGSLESQTFPGLQDDEAKAYLNSRELWGMVPITLVT